MILVTGGTGLLGSHLLYELVREHEEVVALKRPSSDLRAVKRTFACRSEEWEDYFRLIDWVDADLLSPSSLDALMLDVDQVYHCAAMVSFHPGEARKMIHYNDVSTENIVNLCMEAGVEKLLHVSSSSTIGKAPAGQEATEDHIWARTRTSSAYSLSKFRSEMRVWRGIEEGLKAVIVNPGIIMGGGHGNRGSSSVFVRVDRGLSMAAPGVTGFVGVEDVVTVMTRLMDSEITGERFIVSSENLSYKEVFEMIAAALGKPRIMGEVKPAALLTLARLDGIRGALTGKRALTPYQARSAFQIRTFSNRKVCETLDFEFTPVKQVIARVASCYQKEFSL